MITQKIIDALYESKDKQGLLNLYDEIFERGLKMNKISFKGRLCYYITPGSEERILISKKKVYINDEEISISDLNSDILYDILISALKYL